MLTFDAEKHEYRWGSVVVPSVTQIIRAMPCWAEHGGADAEYHMSVGSAVHSVIAGQTKPEDYAVEHWHEIHPYTESWRRGVEAFNVRVHQWEVRQFCRKHRYAGTLDARGIVGINQCIIDIKTGSPAKWHALQTAAYEHMGNMCKRCCIYLDSEGGFPRIVWHDNAGDIGAFLGWLNYARWAGVITC